MTWNQFATIRKTRLGQSLVAAISLALLWASPTQAGTTITPMPGVCPVLIAQSGEYDLAGDVGPCLVGDGIDILASGVTLHLNGHTITGAPTCSSSDGIHVGVPAPAPPLAQVHILGPGTIANFARAGIFAENSAGSFAKFVTVTTECTSFFIGLEILASQWKLQGNVVQLPTPGGVTAGILLNGPDNDVVHNIVNNGGLGIQAGVSSDNTLIVNNTVSGTQFAGISTHSNVNNEIHANTTDNNLYGIFIFDSSSGNNITGNTSTGNSAEDLQDQNPNCDSNKWEGNHFDTANQSCIH